MISESPLISIVVPVYNREELVKISIESLLLQTYDNWEMLLVDDGSTDNTVEVIKKYAANDSRIKVFIRNTPIKGGNVCRNIGLKNATGKFVIFLDSDDKLKPFCLQQRNTIANQHPNYDFYVFPGIKMHINGQENNPENYLMSVFDGSEDALPLFLNHDFPWPINAPMYRLNAIKKHDLYFDEMLQVHQDVLYHVTSICRGMKFFIPDSNIVPDFVCIDHHYGHVGTKVNPKHLDSNLRYVSQLKLELIKGNVYKDSYKKFFLKFLLNDLNRYAIYIRKKENVDKIISKIKDLELIKPYQTKILKGISMLLMCLPNALFRRKVTSLLYLCLFPHYNNKYFLSQKIKDSKWK